jgi:hypothetical protein
MTGGKKTALKRVTVDKAEKSSIGGFLTEIGLTGLNSSSDSLERQAFL